jgi:hypothetical protein
MVHSLPQAKKHGMSPLGINTTIFRKVNKVREYLSPVPDFFRKYGVFQGIQHRRKP